MDGEKELFEKMMDLMVKFEQACNEVDAAIAEVSQYLNDTRGFSVMPRYSGVLAPPRYPADEKIENALVRIEYECERLVCSIALRRKALQEVLELQQRLPPPNFSKDIIF